MPCCWPPTDERGHVVEPAGRGGGLGERAQPGPRVDLGAVRVGGAAGPDELPGVGVPDDHLAGLGRRVDTRDEGHRGQPASGAERIMGGTLTADRCVGGTYVDASCCCSVTGRATLTADGVRHNLLTSPTNRRDRPGGGMADERSRFDRSRGRRHTPADQATVRRSNLGLVLRHLRDAGSRSRARIAQETGLNKATVSSLVAELTDRAAGQRRRRRPRRLGRAAPG